MAQFIQYDDYDYINLSSIDRITYGKDEGVWYVYMYYNGMKKRYRAGFLTQLEAKTIINQLMADIGNGEKIISIYGGIQDDTGYHGNLRKE